MLVVFNAGIDRHRDGLGTSDKSNSVVGVKTQDFVGYRQRINIVLLFQEAGRDVLQYLNLVLSDPLVFLRVFR